MLITTLYRMLQAKYNPPNFLPASFFYSGAMVSEIFRKQNFRKFQKYFNVIILNVRV